MKLPRRTWVLSAGILTALVLAGIWAWPPDEPATRRLPDGSVLTLKAATFQKRHRVRTGNRWLDYLGANLPESWARKLDCRFITFGGRTNALDFWLVWDSLPPGNLRSLRALMFDEHGCEFVSAPPDISCPWGAARQALTFQFTEFPRRDRTVGIRLYQQATNGIWSRLAEYSVPNPDTRTHPVWMAEPLPITRSAGGVDFTLLELKTGSAASTDYPGASGAWVSFRITKRGQPTSAWEFAGLNGISDALGHTARSGYSTSMTDTGAFRIGVNAGLCAEEAAWRVDVEFARSKDFPEDELWNIRSVPIPEKNTASVVEAVTNLHGVPFRFRGIVGVGCPIPRLRRSISGSPVAHVACTNLPGNVQLKFVHAVDDRGRKVGSGGSAGDPPDYLFGLRLAPDAKTVDLTFAVTKRLPVQYLVKPSRLSAGEWKKLRP